VAKEIFLGWDIGGANTKVCVFNTEKKIIRVHKKNLKIWDDFNDINLFFDTVLSFYKNYEIKNFITITAESCDNFKDRKEGVTLILSQCNKNIIGKNYYYTNKNTYIDYNQALKEPTNLFSTNWILTANFLNTSKNIDVLVDVGSTTTDILFKNIDIDENINDYKRLTNKTLLYAGVVRTPIPMLTDEVLYRSNTTSLVREVFATTGDIFNILGDIDFSDHDYMGSDNLQFTVENSLVRLSRLIGLDYDRREKKYIIEVAQSIKKLFIKKIIDNINYIFDGNTERLVISSIGEGAFLVEDMCKMCKLTYKSIENENIFNFEDVNKKLVYENITAALVVKNFFIKKIYE